MTFALASRLEPTDRAALGRTVILIQISKSQPAPPASSRRRGPTLHGLKKHPTKHVALQNTTTLTVIAQAEIHAEPAGARPCPNFERNSFVDGCLRDITVGATRCGWSATQPRSVKMRIAGPEPSRWTPRAKSATPPSPAATWSGRQFLTAAGANLPSGGGAFRPGVARRGTRGSKTRSLQAFPAFCGGGIPIAGHPAA
jgi:hypothetical protein